MSEPTGWKWPAPGYHTVTQDYSSDHPAVDISTPEDATIRAVDGGWILHSGWNEDGYGNLVIIQHNYGGETYKTYYAHLNSINSEFKGGYEVKKGQTVGKADSTGNSTGNHLHFELRKSNNPVDPRPYLEDAEEGGFDDDDYEGDSGDNGESDDSGLPDWVKDLNMVNVALIAGGIVVVFMGILFVFKEMSARVSGNILSDYLGGKI